MQIIGHITLNISMLIYLIWFTPQIFLNFKRKDTEGLSMVMYGILGAGYLSDLVYGFGRDMQWQYRMVTIIGLCSLAIQNYQFGRYGLHRTTEKYTYIGLNIFYISFFLYAVFAVIPGNYDKEIYNSIGMIANLCWLGYMLPQIIKNYVNQSTVGLSISFVILALFLNICDSTSAWTLGWDYPSKIGPAIALFGNLILLSQLIYYGRKQKFNRLAFDR